MWDDYEAIFESVEEEKRRQQFDTITVFPPHIVSAAKDKFIQQKIEILRQIEFPNLKKNSFRGNYMRK